MMYSRFALSNILELFAGDRGKAARYCISVAIKFPQFAAEYNDYANTLMGGQHG
jgi:hypothetical protein